MTEGYRNSDLPSPDFLAELTARLSLARQEYATPHGVESRFRLYDYAEDRRLYYLEAYDHLNCSPGGTLLDVGCAEGTGLMLIRLLKQHSGRIIGVDINETNFAFGNITNSRLSGFNIRPIEFMVGEAENLGHLTGIGEWREQRQRLDDNTIDGAMIMFTLYHTDINRALGELLRVTKRGSRIAIATSSILNKQKQRGFELAIADYINDAFGIRDPERRIRPPARFTDPFDKEGAPAILAQYPLRLDTVLRQQCEMVIWADESLDDYLGALASMWPHFGPRPHPSLTNNMFHEAVEAVVIPKMLEEIQTRGSFVDWVERITYICENLKEA
jgi:SAM-dependent methyltransferase